MLAAAAALPPAKNCLGYGSSLSKEYYKKNLSTRTQTHTPINLYLYYSSFNQRQHKKETPSTTN